MAIATFDTLKFANTLKAADLPPKQAEALAGAFAEVIQLNFKDLATKEDLRALENAIRAELKSEFKDLRVEINGYRDELKADDKDVRSDIKVSRDSLKSEIKDVRDDLKNAIVRLEAEMRIMRWILSAIGGGLMLILGIALRYLFLHGGL